MDAVPTRERPEWHPARPSKPMSTLTATSCRGPPRIYISDEFVSIKPRPSRQHTVNPFTHQPTQPHARGTRTTPRPAPTHKEPPHRRSPPSSTPGTRPSCTQRQPSPIAQHAGTPNAIQLPHQTPARAQTLPPPPKHQPAATRPSVALRKLGRRRPPRPAPRKQSCRQCQNARIGVIQMSPCAFLLWAGRTADAIVAGGALSGSWSSESELIPSRSPS
jgi:hypothetical protein